MVAKHQTKANSPALNADLIAELWIAMTGMSVPTIAALQRQVVYILPTRNPVMTAMPVLQAMSALTDHALLAHLRTAMTGMSVPTIAALQLQVVYILPTRNPVMTAMYALRAMFALTTNANRALQWSATAAISVAAP
jgi:hypothetical protein